MALILVIDDDCDYSSTLKDLLELLSHKVLIATTGIDALELLISKRMPIELILIDENMPKIKGSILAQVIKKQLDPPPPYIYVTGELGLPEEAEGPKVLRKPVGLEDLRDAIELCLAQK
ncbi:MAG: response regulator [Oligoflexales bacterium]